MYSEAGNPTSVEIMFPGNYGIGKAIAAEVNRRKKAKKMASEKGLIVPVVRQINRLSLLEVAAARQALTDRVRAGTQTPVDLAGGTFTVTNLGMFGIEAFDPIITPGQAGILAAGKVANALLIDEDGRMRVTPTLTLTLACDHRIADGVDGARFLADLKALLENPERLFTGLV